MRRPSPSSALGLDASLRYQAGSTAMWFLLRSSPRAYPFDYAPSLRSRGARMWYGHMGTIFRRRANSARSPTDQSAKVMPPGIRGRVHSNPTDNGSDSFAVTILFAFTKSCINILIYRYNNFMIKSWPVPRPDYSHCPTAHAVNHCGVICEELLQRQGMPAGDIRQGYCPLFICNATSMSLRVTPLGSISWLNLLKIIANILNVTHDSFSQLLLWGYAFVLDPSI